MVNKSFCFYKDDSIKKLIIQEIMGQDWFLIESNSSEILL